ncbi:MAG: hypothetical protein WC445_03680 [Patescibacteria group bacterium]
MKKFLPIFIAIVIIVGGAAFYGGMKYGESKRSIGVREGFSDFGKVSFGDRQGFAGEAGALGGKNIGANFVSGEIISKDDKSLTVKLPDGGSKIIFFSDATKITKTAEGAMEDLKVGENVMANGTANDGGSITAETIQLRPTMVSPTNTNSNNQ